MEKPKWTFGQPDIISMISCPSPTPYLNHEKSQSHAITAYIFWVVWSTVLKVHASIHLDHTVCLLKELLFPV